MPDTRLREPPVARTEARPLEARTGAVQAYRVLHAGFVVLPILAGLDKFAGVLTHWEQYLAPFVQRYVQPGVFMSAVGVIEVAAGLLVAVRPKIGGYVVALWMWAIIANLLMIPGYYDVALRDFGLSLGALALARLARDYE
jgi:uncharacterized membrane protein HdeD (DUF308 family)